MERAEKDNFFFQKIDLPLKWGEPKKYIFFQRIKRNIDVILGEKKKFVVSRQKWSGEKKLKKLVPPPKKIERRLFFNKFFL